MENPKKVFYETLAIWPDLCSRCPGGLCFDPGQPPADGKHPHRNLQSDVRSRDLRVVELGCNTALDAGLYTFTFAKTGASVSGRYSYTYRWDGAKWLITSHHSSVMPEK